MTLFYKVTQTIEPVRIESAYRTNKIVVYSLAIKEKFPPKTYDSLKKFLEEWEDVENAE